VTVPPSFDTVRALTDNAPYRIEVKREVDFSFSGRAAAAARLEERAQLAPDSGFVRRKV